MSGFVKTLGRWGGIITLILLLITLVRQLIALVSFLLAAIKIGIVLAFVGLFVIIILAMLRARRKRRSDAEEI